MVLTPTYHVFKMYVPFQDATFVPVTFDAGTYTHGDITLPRVDAIAAKDASRQAVAGADQPRSQPAGRDRGERRRASRRKSAAGETLTAPKVDSVNTFDAPNTVAPKPISAKVQGGRLIADARAQVGDGDSLFADGSGLLEKRSAGRGHVGGWHGGIVSTIATRLCAAGGGPVVVTGNGGTGADRGSARGPGREAGRSRAHQERRDRARDRVHVVPQRAAARVGARDGRLHRGRRGGDRAAGRRRPFDAFPNSYGSLGYATRLRIELERVPAVSTSGTCASTTSTCPPGRREIVATREWEGVPVDGLDGVVFSPDEVYLTLATWARRRGDGHRDYTGQGSTSGPLQERTTDPLTMLRLPVALGHRLVLVLGSVRPSRPRVRRLWPRRWRRSDVYHRLVGLDHRFGFYGPPRPPQRRSPASGWSRTSRCRSSRLADFLRLVRRATSGCGRCGCARCGCASRRPGTARTWPSTR